jgi:hypothetical protein
MEYVNPLHIQELIASCINYIADSSRDLKARALVSQCWTYAAQSHLFRAPIVASGDNVVVNDNRWAQFRDIGDLPSSD